MKRNVLWMLSAIMLMAFMSKPIEALGDEVRGEKSVGLRTGYTTRNNTATAGLYFSYRFSKHFRLAPKIEYAFRHNNTDAFLFNFDCEIPFSLSSTGRVNLYPIAGLNYSTFTTKYDSTGDSSLDSSERTNDMGLNLGGGLEFFATPTLRIAFEGKCLLIKENTGGWFSLSLGYRF